MYGKFFSSAYTGSMRGAGPVVFAVWGYVIANTNQHSVIEINPEIVAFMLGTTPGEVEKAVEFLCSPDEKSRCKDNDGRRLVKDGEYQYFVTTHKRYSQIKNSDEQREYNREKKREQRERERGVKPHVKNVKNVKECPRWSKNVTTIDIHTDSDKGLGNTLPPPAAIVDPKKPRERNPLFDALAKLDGWTESNPLTGTAGGRVGSALADIKTACPHLTVEEIGRRIRNYQARYPDAPITSTALASNWALCDTGAQPVKKKYDDRPL